MTINRRQEIPIWMLGLLWTGTSIVVVGDASGLGQTLAAIFAVSVLLVPMSLLIFSLKDRHKLRLGEHMTVQVEIERSTTFGQQLEDLIVKKGSVTTGEAGDRDKLLLAYWSLVLDYDKSVLALMRNRFYAGAFALLRPLVEALVRAHVTLIGSDEDIEKIKADTYRTSFTAIGAQIDSAFGLEGLFDRFLNGSRGALHSFTHSGLSQLGRRFTGNDLQARYGDGEIIEVIHTASSAVFMVTNLIAKHFKCDADDLLPEI